MGWLMTCIDALVLTKDSQDWKREALPEVPQEANWFA